MKSTPPLFEVVSFVPAHAYLAETRPERRLSKEAARKIGDVGGVAYTALYKGKWAGSAGAIAMWPGRVQVWALMPETAGFRQTLLFTRTTKDFIDFLFHNEICHRVEATVDVGFAPGVKWARMLGMVPEGTMVMYGPDGHDHFLYARTILLDAQRDIDNGTRNTTTGGNRNIRCGWCPWYDQRDSIRKKLG